jgi:protein TonB
MSYQALLFCPDDKTARVVTQVLTELDFTVEPCNEPFAAVKKLMAQHFDALVVDCDNEQNATLLFKSARNSGSNQTSLAVAVVEGQAGVAKAFRIGANLVLTKPINVEQSKGTLRVARGLLRKADSAKPVGGTPLAAETSARPAIKPLDSVRPTPPAPPAPKPAAVSFAALKTAPAAAIPPVAASAFEVEQDPTPEPEPAEAALLESMPDPAPTVNKQPAAAKSAGSSKEYPWQPVSKPLSEPMASALRRAAEAAGRVESDSPVASKAADPRASVTNAAGITDSRPFPGSMSAGHSTASAPAPAKEASWPSADTFEHRPPATIAPAPETDKESKPKRPAKEASLTAMPAVEVPTFSSLGDTQNQEASDARGSKKTLFIAVAVIAVAVAGYFGWTRMHPSSQMPGLQRPATPVQSPAPAPTPQVPNSQPQEIAPAGTQSQAFPDKENHNPEPEQTATAPSGKPSAAKGTIVASSDAPVVKPVPAEKTEPLVVKKEISNHPSPKPAAPEPVQAPDPDVLGVSSNTGEQTISGIVSTTPVSVPKPIQQTLRVSQGVTQGMLLKKVQPVYPPQALQMRTQGAVQLQASIDKAGNIAEVKLLSGDQQLARAAMAAVRQWKYKPYYLNGEPVEIQTQITVNFKLP